MSVVACLLSRRKADRVDKKKDTVIPNSFPFKDKVLAEQAEEKRAVSLPHVFS